VRISNREGTFRTDFDATDNCGVDSVNAVMEIPNGAGNFQIVFDRQDRDDSKIIFNVENHRIILEGRDENALRVLLAAILAGDGVGVTQDQQLRLTREGGSRFEFTFNGTVLTDERAPRLRLRVTAEDAAGNRRIITATPRFGD
jgi:hypothetical protein